jgi:hypothetical protein
MSQSSPRFVGYFSPLMALTAALVLFVLPKDAQAIPAFSRQYGTSCSTCHSNFPKLNDFGKAFKDAGFKFPADDETMMKIPPVMLGAPAQAEVWPHTIWPGKIPGQPPIGLRFNTYFQTVGANRGNFAFVPNSTTTATIPRTDFESGLFSIFTAGNFGSDIAFWVDDDISVSGDNSGGGLGDGYLRFVNIGRLMHLPKDSLSLRVGQFELDLPFTQARSINISPYDIYSQANIGTIQQNVNNGFTLGDAARGAEISGGHHYGGYWYSFAVIDQNTTGNTNDSSLVPSALGAANGGLGFQSDSNFKDLYGRFMYRFNLERDKESRNAVQAASATGARDHTSLALGSFYLYGRSVNRLTGVASDLATPATPATLTAREPFYRVGGDFSFNYRALNLYGLYMYGHDHDLIPVAGPGQSFPVDPAVGFVRGSPTTFGGGFLQADYLVYPWMMMIMRYDAVNSHADFLNGQIGAQGTPLFGPASVTRNRFTPGVQFLIHANIKASFEYQIRPRQQIAAGVDPVTGAAVAVSPFRTNAATAGLEWVF